MPGCIALTCGIIYHRVSTGSPACMQSGQPNDKSAPAHLHRHRVRRPPLLLLLLLLLLCGSWAWLSAVI
jgi:hypothetical protein